MTVEFEEIIINPLIPHNAYQAACDVVLKKFNDSQEVLTELYPDIVKDFEALTLLLKSLLSRDNWADYKVEDLEIPPIHAPEDTDVAEFQPDPMDLVEAEFDPPPPPPDPGYTGIDISDLEEPEVGDLVEPNISLNTGLVSYDSSMLELLKNKLEHDLEFGGTGLGADVEEQIFQRELERSILVHSDTMDRIAAEWSKRGFDMPNGVLAMQFQEAQINYSNKRLDTSRDISIKQAEIADANTKFAVQHGITIETQFMNFQHLCQQRIYEASLATAKAQIELYTAQLKRYQILTEIYVALVNSRIEQAKGIAQVYTAQVDAYRSRVQAEAERIRAVIEANRAEIERYKTDALVYQTVSDVAIREFEALIRRGIADGELRAKELDLKLRRWEIANKVSLESVTARSQVLAHIIAGLMSSVSAGAEIRASGATQTNTNL
jgi:hypothetical protein